MLVLAAMIASLSTFQGISALRGAAPTTHGHMTVKRSSETSATIDFWETRAGTTVRAYDVDMTKRLHLVVIGPAFMSFQHLHPRLDARGHFTLALAVPVAGTYQFYADTLPHGDPQTVFRFAVPFGTATRRDRMLPVVRKTEHAGPYTVSIDTSDLATNAESEIHVAISRAGKPATDLTSYLGAAAHVVLIQTETLGYTHVHPDTPGATHDDMAMHGTSMAGMSMGAMPELPAGTHVAPSLTLHAEVARPGAYFMWVQFAGGNGIHVARFLITAH